MESFISASYSLFGGDPVTYLTAKKVMAALAFVLGMLVWGILGQGMGLVPKSIALERDREEETER